MGACFTLKHQRHCGENFCDSLINIEILEELWLQQEIKEAHDNKEAYNTRPVYDHKNCTVSAFLIEQHFGQICGRDGVPCAYLMHEHTQPPARTGLSDGCAELFDDQMIKQYPIIKPAELLSNLPVPDLNPPLKHYTCKAAEDNPQCCHELQYIAQGTEANIHLEFQAAWRKFYNTFLSTGSKDTLAAQLEKDIQTFWYNGPRHRLMFNTCVECHKQAYQSMLALAKKTDNTTYDPSKRVRNFLNGITNPPFAQANLSLEANCEQYSGNFDATVEYLMHQVLHQQVNQSLLISSMGSDTAGYLKTRNDCGKDLEMPLDDYLPKDWAQLLPAQKSIIQKRHAEAYGVPHHGCGGGLGGRGDGDCKRPRGPDCGCGDKPKSAEYKALAASIATLFKNINVIPAHMVGKASNNEDAKPAADGKMGANMKNSAFCKKPKRRRNDTRLCLLGWLLSRVIFALLSLLSL